MFRFVILISILVCSLAINVSAQEQLQDVVYLKDDSIIRGMIVEQIPNVSIKIQTWDGSVFVCKMEDVEKITKEPEVKRTPKKKGPMPYNPSPVEDSPSLNHHWIRFELSVGGSWQQPTGEFGKYVPEEFTEQGMATPGLGGSVDVGYLYGERMMFFGKFYQDRFGFNKDASEEFWREASEESGVFFTSPLSFSWRLDSFVVGGRYIFGDSHHRNRAYIEGGIATHKTSLVVKIKGEDIEGSGPVFDSGRKWGPELGAGLRWSTRSNTLTHL